MTDSPAMKTLDPADFFGDDNIKRDWVDIPELEGRVLVRSLSTLEHDDYELRLTTGKFVDGYRAWIAYHCTINEDGSLFFAREENGKPVPKEKVIHELAVKNPWGILNRICDKITELSAPGLDFESVKKSSPSNPEDAFSD